MPSPKPQIAPALETQGHVTVRRMRGPAGDQTPARSQARRADMFRILRQRGLAAEHYPNDGAAQDDMQGAHPNTAFLAAVLARPEPVVARALNALAKRRGVSGKPTADRAP